jgi:oligoribonuclease
MPKKDIIHLLWIDLETTGLETLGGGDEIIEIACILTDQQLNVISEFTSVVKPSPAAYERLVANQYVFDMHSKNGLLDALSEGDPVDLVSYNIRTWLRSLSTCEKFTLAGSGVGPFDLPTIRARMPKLALLLNYWVIDVGVLRRAHDLFVGDIWGDVSVSDANDLKKHRAIDDVRCHLEDGRAYREMWRHTQANEAAMRSENAS